MPSRIDLLRFWVSCERELTLQGNLLNLHSGKYSGLSNNKVVDISASPEGAITVTKTTANGGKVASTSKSTTLRRSTGPRRANKIAAVETAAKGFRADLRSVSRRFLSTLVSFQQPSRTSRTTCATKVARRHEGSSVLGLQHQNAQNTLLPRLLQPQGCRGPQCSWRHYFHLSW